MTVQTNQIAMWNCPRSRSTAITRSFEQLEGCTIFDTPFYLAYLETANNRGVEYDYPEANQVWEADPAKVIAQMTTAPPEGQFVFQRHISRTVLPEFGRDWLASLNSFFLIRDPREILISYHKVFTKYGVNDRPVDMEDVGVELLSSLFDDVQRVTGKVPLVVHSDDIASEPAKVLPRLCEQLGIPFSERMLSWKANLEGSAMRQQSKTDDNKRWSETWYSNVNKSSGFIPFEKKVEPLPEELEPLLAECMPHYEKLLAHRMTFN